MRKGIQNNIVITVDGVDLTDAIHIELYVRQGAFFRQYTPVITDKATLQVSIPKADADAFIAGETVELQLAMTDHAHNPLVSEIAVVRVKEFLKDGGYDAH